MTKKQLNALRRNLEREAATYQERVGRPTPGQHPSKGKAAITDGSICVLLDELSPELPTGKRANSFASIIRNERSSDSYFPISADQIRVSDWRALAKKQAGDGSGIELTVQPDSDPPGPGQSILNLIMGRFNPQLLVNAVDAVGGGNPSSSWAWAGSVPVFRVCWCFRQAGGTMALPGQLPWYFHYVFEEVAHVAEKYTFPVPGCSTCPHYEVVGGITRYCIGFKRRKPKRFKNSDPRYKAPKWCPRRLSPPVYRIYGFKDECSEYIELINRMDYDLGRTKIISPSASHYKPRIELRPSITAKQFYEATQEEPLCDILPEKVDSGEIIEIDDGLQPYYFYLLDYATVIPLPYFYLTKGDTTQ